MVELSRPVRKAGGVFDRLDTDWAVLCGDASVRAAVAGWLAADHLAVEVAEAAGSWTNALGPEQVLAALRPGTGMLSDALADSVLRALLLRAGGRGRAAALAARIVVQAMVPAAVRMVRGQVRPFGGRTFDDVADVVVAALYETACSGRIHTRPGRPAANLVLDTLHQVCRDLAADREPLGVPLPADDQVDPASGPADHVHAHAVRDAADAAGLRPVTSGEQEMDRARLELLELLLDAMEAGTLTPADGRAIAWHYTAVPVPDVRAAAAAGTSAGAWQRRRSRAVRALRTSLQPTAA
ncbi:hypothetical protein AB0K43_30060 [Kitasatospora sp. NPDC049258]|uniref:hypothetical protein n=1 Tax=Kitasatospora sp. NPDC049258 TaxID=3155394 RepID=UPI003448C384